MKLVLILFAAIFSLTAKAGGSDFKAEKMVLTSLEGGKKQIRIYQTTKDGKTTLTAELDSPNKKTKRVEIDSKKFELIESLALEQTWENNFKSKSRAGKCEKVFEIRIHALNERSEICKGEHKREFNTRKLFGQVLMGIFRIHNKF